MTKLNEVKIMLTVKMSKSIGELTDLVSGRVYTMDGVEDVTATLMEDDPSDPTQPLKKKSFDTLIQHFNSIYKLGTPEVPTLRSQSPAGVVKNLQNFKNILLEEINEVDAICTQLENDQPPAPKVLTEIADWLGDIMVYCASELAKYGLKSEDVLGIIMASNFSKLNSDGQPLYDERGKVMKGPYYWKPEPMIESLIRLLAKQVDQKFSEPHGY